MTSLFITTFLGIEENREKDFKIDLARPLLAIVEECLQLPKPYDRMQGLQSTQGRHQKLIQLDRMQWH